MNRTIQTNEENLNPNSTTIHRTFIEHGIRPINNNNNSSTIKIITKQHEDEKRELQELNTKLLIYLDHVQHLENYNGQLLAELDNITEKWSDNTEQFNTTYGPQLQLLRKTIDNNL